MDNPVLYSDSLIWWCVDPSSARMDKDPMPVVVLLPDVIIATLGVLLEVEEAGGRKSIDLIVLCISTKSMPLLIKDDATHLHANSTNVSTLSITPSLISSVLLKLLGIIFHPEPVGSFMIK
ncbi:ORF1332 [White spot syndrome virus]|uniref:Wsv443 n=3 Tax=White spot syndrome virus TaxID=342409 RepID=Q8VAH2_WSSVS|nr:wsv443 [Shrimp white spot syndrome virus]AFX59820.1 wsv443 [White spot syndrome virus]AAL33444.1 wsv443 [Shrimp white spot syndrome virus]AAL89371.1 WSSV503 [Shrimp white spot syndrome virus]ATU83568.1 ORF1332 [White spot syndrome virus]AWQ60567.1 wsv443 [Shrimp white spot syndrome virus]